MCISAWHEGGHDWVAWQPAPRPPTRMRCTTSPQVNGPTQHASPFPTFNLPPRSSVLLDCFEEALVLFISPPLSLLRDNVRFTSLRDVG